MRVKKGNNGNNMILSELCVRFAKKTGIYYDVEFYKATKKVQCKSSDRGRIFLLMTPTYGNVGDQAIEIATIAFFEDYFPEYEIIRVHLQDTYSSLKNINKEINSKDIVVLQGGGNFGDYYHDVENARRFIIKKIHAINVIVMPVTISYNNSREIKKSQKIYNKFPSMLLCVREKYSLNMSSKLFSNCTPYLIPDIVFYLQKPDIPHRRTGILLCLRQDCESVISRVRDKLIKELIDNYEDVTLIDTQLYRGISDELKDIEVQQMLNNFKRSELVITDRLHGLIFSAITHTPCIVLPSKDKKIVGTYVWLQDLNYISMVEEPTFWRINEEIKHLKLVREKNDVDFKRIYFESFANYLKNNFLKINS